MICKFCNKFHIEYFLTAKSTMLQNNYEQIPLTHICTQCMYSILKCDTPTDDLKRKLEIINEWKEEIAQLKTGKLTKNQKRIVRIPPNQSDADFIKEYTEMLQKMIDKKEQQLPDLNAKHIIFQYKIGNNEITTQQLLDARKIVYPQKDKENAISD
jgi:hypothetical protein